MTPIHLVCDFDSTLATSFVAGDMYRDHAPPEQVAKLRMWFLDGEISFRAYQEEVFDLVDQSTAEMSARAMSGTSVRNLAGELFAEIWKHGGTVTVASAGLNFYIEPVLENAGFEHVDIACGIVLSDPAELPPFRYDYPSAGKSCIGDWVTCKCEVIRDRRQGCDQSEIIFVGDGLLSDSCAARNEADTVFATGRLLEFCNENGIEAIEFDKDFGPVLEYLVKKTSTNGDH
ncbi:MAG: HAD-IB family phosphatase [Chloroflexi bacterium]|nr:HAD-IB family phosphatase [Chloroflexota bacterium]